MCILQSFICRLLLVFCLVFCDLIDARFCLELGFLFYCRLYEKSIKITLLAVQNTLYSLAFSYPLNVLQKGSQVPCGYLWNITH
jgi:hypothetical protein